MIIWEEEKNQLFVINLGQIEVLQQFSMYVWLS